MLDLFIELEKERDTLNKLAEKSLHGKDPAFAQITLEQSHKVDTLLILIEKTIQIKK